jgi:membrane-associated phospholipid phosphatase
MEPPKDESSLLGGPTERPLVAWRRAFCHWDFALTSLWVLFGFGFPQLLPHHVRDPPGQEHLVKTPLLDNEYLDSSRQTVPAFVLFLIVTILPTCVALLLSVLAPARGAARAWLLGYLWTMSSTELVVGCVKQYVGYWRPYYYQECGWEAGHCTKDVADATKSFPSGHAASSMAALLFTSLRLIGACRLGAPPQQA